MESTENFSIVIALTEIITALKRFVCFKSPDDLLVTALYVLLTHCINPADGGFNMFPILPFLLITGDPGSGKTQLMKVLKRLCFRARFTSSISHAGFYRIVHNNRGTLLVDEAEDLQHYQQKSFRFADLLSGNERDGCVTLADIRSGGNVEYSTFGPKIFGNVKGIAHKALRSRCIEIILENPFDEEYKPKIKRFLHNRHDQEVRAIEERLEILFRQDDLRQRILDHYESFEGINGYWGRETDSWAPLLATSQEIEREKPEWKLYEKVLGIAGKDVEWRRRESLLKWENRCLIATYHYLKDIHYSPNNYVIGEDIAKFVSKQLRLKYPLKTETLGHFLRNHSLLLPQPDNPGHKVKWVRDEDGNLIQRTCYWIGMIKFSKFAKKFEKYVEYEKPTDSSEEDLPEALCKDIDFGDEKK